MLESVEVDMAKLEIDKEDVHDRKKWRRNVMKRKSNASEKCFSVPQPLCPQEH